MAQKSNKFALITLTTLFFIIGFVTVLNDILGPHLQKVFELNHFETAFISFFYFGVYITGGIFGRLLGKIGYSSGVILGFVLAALGCALFYPAASFTSYPIFLGALFILAIGIVLLQTAGNPFVTLLAPPGKEARTLTLVQAFNSLGTTVGPLFGSAFILADATKLTKMQEAQSVQLPYLGIGIVLLILACIVYFLRLPDVRKRAEEISLVHRDDTRFHIKNYPHLILGAGAIFFYVGAEVSIGFFLIKTMEEVAQINEKIGGKILAYYWGGAMIGRFLGSIIMGKIAPNKCLAFNAIAIICLIIFAISVGGKAGIVALIMIGLFNSIMFPTIFSLATKDLGRFTARGSGIISMAIVGGGIMPLFQGFVIEQLHITLLMAHIIPMLCYFYVLFFAIKGYKIKKQQI